MTNGRIVSLLAAFALTAAACKGSGGQKSPPPPPQASQNVLPPVVAQVEGLAEDIQTDLDSLGWTAARAKLVELQASDSTLRTAIPAAAAAALATYEAARDSLAAQIGRRARLAALASANRMSRALLAIAAEYDTTVPIQVGLLDVAGRDAINRAESGDWQGAGVSVAELQSQYAAVQAHVALKDTALDARVTRELADLKAAVSAKNAARVRTVATRLLDDVDLIERTY
jgi:hypothetical protein